jgi:hypothetical protein|tara:strand:+ start:1089 stop:1778 length:690 start_codon:yes stop_codon:yes gene_type:complete
MPTALEVLQLKAMSLSSGYGRWSVERRGSLSGSHGDNDGSWEWNIDTSPRKTKLFTHNPEQEVGQQMMNASLPEYTLFDKALKYRWFAWNPGDDCRAREFKPAHVEKVGNTGANRLVIGDAVMGCPFCRVEPVLELVIPELEPEVEVSTSAITTESRAAVDSGAPKERTELPSALSKPTPPAATKPRLSECPGCGKAGKGKSVKKQSSSVYAHLKSYPDHAETPIGVSV